MGLRWCREYDNQCLESLIIGDKNVHEPHLDKNEFIDNESNDEEYNEYEYINDE